MDGDTYWNMRAEGELSELESLDDAKRLVGTKTRVIDARDLASQGRLLGANAYVQYQNGEVQFCESDGRTLDA